MPVCRICVGISGSGKSTYAQDLVKKGFVEINRDTIRFNTFTDGVEDWGLYKFTSGKESAVSQIEHRQWDEAVFDKRKVVISNTNLDIKYHTLWKARAEEAGYEFEVVYFSLDLESAFKRDLRRGGKAVGRGVLIRQYQQWMKLTNARKYVPDLAKPRTIVSDIDGSIAEMVSRGPYDWARVGEDLPRKDIIKLIRAIKFVDSAELVFVSGRDGSCYEQTWSWLKEHIPDIDFTLYMRKPGDQRKDTIIKEEILFEDIAPDHNITYWFDDRSCVVRNLKLLGVNVIDVSSGLIEF